MALANSIVQNASLISNYGVVKRQPEGAVFIVIGTISISWFQVCIEQGPFIQE